MKSSGLVIMKIKSILARGFKKLAFSNINSIHYTPESELQIILGTNGSGKSSLLSIAWPNVPKTSEWETTGRYELEVEHNGNHYRLMSIFNPKPSHSFFKNHGDNLNTGGTSGVQKQLIESEFNIDNDIYSVLSGKLRFTAMSPSKRKEWMSKLSPIDLRWLFNIYTETQKNLRAHQQNINFINKKILEATENLHILNGQAIDEEHYATLQNLLKNLYELKSSSHPSLNLEDKVSKGLNAVDTLHRTRQSSTFIVDGKEVFNSDMLNAENIKDSIQTRLTQNEAMYKTNLEHLANINEIISESSQVNVDLKPTLIAERLRIEQTLADISAKVPSPYLTLNAGKILNEIDKHMVAIHDSSVTIPADPDRKLTQERMNELQAKLTNIDSTLNECVSTLNRSLSVMESHRADESVNCPACSHVWTPGWSNDDHTRLEDLIKDRTEGKRLYEAKRQEVVEELEILYQYRAARLSLKEVLMQSTEIDYWYNSEITEEIIRNNPRSLNYLLSDYMDRMVLVKQYSELSDRLYSVDHDLNLIEKALGNKSSSINERRDALSRSVESLMVLIDSDRRLLKEYTRWINGWIGWFALAEPVNDLMRTLNQQWESKEITLANDYIQGCIKRVESELASVVGLVNQKRSVLSIIQELEKSLADEKFNLESQRLIESSLSPVNGVIAEQLSVSINAVVSGINSVLSEIWEQPIEILPCGIVEGDLDYQFPLMINDEISIDDVSDASLGQKEVIDLAFVQLVYQLLNMTEYPVYLDEIGSGFDEAHRGKLLRYIKSCIESGSMHQVFMVSHYIAQYGGLGVAEFLVLNDSNITVPERYNDHVEIS